VFIGVNPLELTLCPDLHENETELVIPQMSLQPSPIVILKIGAKTANASVFSNGRLLITLTLFGSKPFLFLVLERKFP
jgi:hypothetical protein